MGFWIYALVISMIMPFTMIGFGQLFKKSAPKEINDAFGYRTSMSMKNEETWKFAHNYFGNLWCRVGLISLPLTIVPLLFVIDKSIDTIGYVLLAVIAVQMVLLIGSIFPTEAALKKNFNKDGSRKVDG